MPSIMRTSGSFTKADVTEPLDGSIRRVVIRVSRV